jgi:CheY-like chemotaxis protein
MQQKKALVVDSNPGGRELMRVLLELEGYETMEAGDSLKALELASSASPDLILIDLQMPHQEGFVTAQQLRQRRFKQLMVALTGREMDSDPAQIIATGFSSYISKPVVLQGLHDRLAQLCASH